MIPIRLGVNIDHIATLRNARGGAHPDPVARGAGGAGGGRGRHHHASARGPTAHPRRRRAGREGRHHGAAEPGDGGDRGDGADCPAGPPACLLPGTGEAHRSDHRGRAGRGRAAGALAPVVAALRAGGIRVSLFIDPDPVQLEASAAVGAPVVELHTGAYAHGRPGELETARAAAALTAKLGLECHAGHGLTFDNTPPVAAFPRCGSSTPAISWSAKLCSSGCMR